VPAAAVQAICGLLAPPELGCARLVCAHWGRSATSLAVSNAAQPHVLDMLRDPVLWKQHLSAGAKMMPQLTSFQVRPLLCRCGPRHLHTAADAECATACGNHDKKSIMLTCCQPACVQPCSCTLLRIQYTAVHLQRTRVALVDCSGFHASCASLYGASGAARGAVGLTLLLSPPNRAAVAVSSCVVPMAWPSPWCDAEGGDLAQCHPLNAVTMYWKGVACAEIL
jgi:hypothetical protein